MNEREDDTPRELVPDAWRELDDTLADDARAERDAPVEPPAAARGWLADQRAMHGLLRALHTPDATAREARIEAILARIDAAPAAEPRGRWWLVAAAALLLACAGVWMALPAALPTAEAAVQRVVHELARDVARRFQATLTRDDPRGKEVARHRFAVVVQPGGKFRVDGRIGFGTLQLAEFTIGSDGEEIWMLGANGAFRNAVPVAERERLERRFGDALDLGYLDVHELVRRLPSDFELHLVGRERDAAGRAVLRVACTRKRADARMQLKSAWLLCDEATGMITRLEAEAEFRDGGVRRVVMEYLGEEPAGLVAFTRPW